MTDVQNLNSHYSTNLKVELPSNRVAIAPQTLPKSHLYNDTDATNRWKSINEDIYQESKKENGKSKLGFFKFFMGFVVLFFGVKFARKFFK